MSSIWYIECHLPIEAQSVDLDTLHQVHWIIPVILVLSGILSHMFSYRSLDGPCKILTSLVISLIDLHMIPRKVLWAVVMIWILILIIPKIYEKYLVVLMIWFSFSWCHISKTTRVFLSFIPSTRFIFSSTPIVIIFAFLSVQLSLSFAPQSLQLALI